MKTRHDVAGHPELATRDVAHQGSNYRLRLLTTGDAQAFGAYLDGLSETTRMLFGPHPLDSAEARKLCAALDPLEIMRFGLFADDGTMVGYFLLFPTARPSEMTRYAGAGIELSTETDCTFAPSLADAYQSKGIGSVVMEAIIDIAKSLGFKRMVLSGGTQERNRRGVAFYLKNRFTTVNDFYTESKGEKILNHDMILVLDSGR